jgi:hypothetical protein
MCRNRACVNPNHLRQVTPKINTIENSNSIQAINSKKTHCKRGHSLTGYNLLKQSDNYRRCRKCFNMRGKIYYNIRKSKKLKSG